MKKLINAGLVISSLFGYMEWGDNQSSFIFQVEYSLLFGDAGSTDSFSHPLILIPLIGQVLLLITVFQKSPNNKLSVLGLICLSVIMYFLCFIGVVSTNLSVILSTAPFLILSFLFYQYRYAAAKKRAYEEKQAS